LHLHAAPTELSPFAVIGVEITFCGAIQMLPFSEKVDIGVVDNVPRYHLTTDLPLSSALRLYDGEVHEFNFWVTNTGDATIADFDISFQQPGICKMVVRPAMPLLPGDQASIGCVLTAEKGTDIIGMTIVLSCEGSELCCSEPIRQLLKIYDSLVICRIFPLKLYQGDAISIGYEIQNLSPCTFEYTSIVAASKTQGLIGGRESLLIVGRYQLADLRNNGADAVRTRVITMTQAMEERLGRGINVNERAQAARYASILQRLEAQWSFEWALSHTRRGRLVNRQSTFHAELFSGIESRQVRATVTWLLNGEVTGDVRKNGLYEFVADFQNDEVIRCELLFIGANERVRTIFWEGELVKEILTGATKFKFVLCFTQAGKFAMMVKHITKSGMSGQTPIGVSVAE
jgi:hypothetical protein